MPKLNDLTGKKFGRLTVVSRAENDKHGQTMWLCVCDCGTESTVGRCGLVGGSTKSCGCLQRERSAERCSRIMKTHGGSRDRLYSVWNGMLQRCENSNRPNFKSYGGKGISVCEDWHDFSVFREWAIESGYQESAKYGDCTLDRIDNNGDYEPSNCRWANMTQQHRNTGYNRIVNYNGKGVALSEACELAGLSYHAVCQRINTMGWSSAKALSIPINNRRSL